MTGMEVGMIVKDSLKALELYEKIFEVQRIEVTSFALGINEAVFVMYGGRFHLLDADPKYTIVTVKTHPLRIRKTKFRTPISLWDCKAQC